MSNGTLNMDPIDFIKPENREIAEQKAQESGLPVVAYLLKLADAQLNVYRYAEMEGIEPKQLRKEMKEQFEAQHQEPASPPLEVGYETQISDLDIPGLRTGPLEGAGIFTVADFLATPEKEILEIPRFGSKSFDEICDVLMDAGLLSATSELGAAYQQEQVETEETYHEEEEETYHEEEEMSLRERFTSTMRIYQNAWGYTKQQAVKNLRGPLELAGFSKDDESTFESAIEVVESLLPVTDETIEKVVELGSQLDEDPYHTKVTRPEAVCGAPLEKLNRAQAVILIDEMEEEISTYGEDDEEDMDWTAFE